MISTKRDGSVFSDNHYIGRASKDGRKWTAERWSRTDTPGKMALTLVGVGYRTRHDAVDAIINARKEAGQGEPQTVECSRDLSWWAVSEYNRKCRACGSRVGDHKPAEAESEVTAPAPEAPASDPQWDRIQYLKSLRRHTGGSFDGFPSAELEAEYYQLLGERYDADGSHNLREPVTTKALLTMGASRTPEQVAASQAHSDSEPGKRITTVNGRTGTLAGGTDYQGSPYVQFDDGSLYAIRPDAIDPSPADWSVQIFRGKAWQTTLSTADEGEARFELFNVVMKDRGQHQVRVLPPAPEPEYGPQCTSEDPAHPGLVCHLAAHAAGALHYALGNIWPDASDPVAEAAAICPVPVTEVDKALAGQPVTPVRNGDTVLAKWVAGSLSQGSGWVDLRRHPLPAEELDRYEVVEYSALTDQYMVRSDPSCAMISISASEFIPAAQVCTTCGQPYPVPMPGCEEHTEWRIETRPASGASHLDTPDVCPVTGQRRTDDHRVTWSSADGPFTRCPQCDPEHQSPRDVLDAVAVRRYPSTDAMITWLDNGGLPADEHDVRTVREVFGAGMITPTDVRRVYDFHNGPRGA